MYIKMQKIPLLLIVVATMTLLSTPAAASDGGSSWWDTIKDAGSDLVDTVKEKGPGWVDTAKEKGSAAVEKAKDGLTAAGNAVSEFNQGQQDQFFDWFDQQTHPNAQPSSTDATPDADNSAIPNQSAPEVPSSSQPSDTSQTSESQAPTIIDNSQTYNDNRTYNYYGNSPAEPTSAQAVTDEPATKSQSWLARCWELFNRRVAIDVEMMPFYLLVSGIGILIGVVIASWKTRKK